MSPYIYWIYLGAGKGSEITETSNLVVETVEKKPGAAPKKRFHGDAAKIMTKGNGIKKAFANRNANFSIDVKDAGKKFPMGLYIFW